MKINESCRHGDVHFAKISKLKIFDSSSSSGWISISILVYRITLHIPGGDSIARLSC